MTAELLLPAVQVATLLSAVATVGGLVIGIRIYRRQMNAQLFLAFTARYEAIMSELAEGTRIAHYGPGSPTPHMPGVVTTVLRYLNLCSEEYYLCRTGHLDRVLWAIWERELRRTVKSSLVRPEWPELREEFEAYPEFRDFVDEILREPPNESTDPAVTLPTHAKAPALVPDERRPRTIKRP